MGNRDGIPDGPVGFRLAHELEGLLVGISADGVITDGEMTRLRRWLEENARFASVHPFREIDDHVSKALADGILTPDECDDLLFVIRKYTTVNPHFDQLRGGLQVLMGALTGAAADRHLDELEVQKLSDWLEEWGHLRGLWPYDEIAAIVALMLSQRRIAEDAAYLFDLARQFPIAGAADASTLDGPTPLLVRGVCAVDPEIEFEGRRFVFTGSRDEASEIDSRNSWPHGKASRGHVSRQTPITWWSATQARNSGRFRVTAARWSRHTRCGEKVTTCSSFMRSISGTRLQARESEREHFSISAPRL